MELELLLLIFGVSDHGPAVDHGVELDVSEALVGHVVCRVGFGELTLAEALEVRAIVFLFESFLSFCIDFVLYWFEGAAGLSGNDVPQTFVVIEGEAAVSLCLEGTVKVALLSHGELRILVLLLGLGGFLLFNHLVRFSLT